jgi:glycosyltransferase involved in cell wall biosynthesis
MAAEGGCPTFPARRLMHILLVHQYYLDGGADQAGGSRWNQMARFFAERGHRISVLAGTVNYATGLKRPEYRRRIVVREQDGPNIDVYRCYVSSNYGKSFVGRACGYFSFAASAAWAARRIKRPDVLICTSPPLPVVLAARAVQRRFAGLPMIFEVRDLWPESAIGAGVTRNSLLVRTGYWMERMAYRHSTWVNVLTPAFRRVLEQEKGVDPARISMLPNGADFDIFTPGRRENWVREKYGLGDRFVALYAGGFGAATAVMQLVEAARQLDPARFCVVLVGDGMQRGIIEQRVREWGLAHVILTGMRPKREVVDFCAAADVCCAVLRKADVFKTVYPNKVFDYMSAARPVIVAIDGQARELVESAQCGLFVEPENPAALARAIEELATQPELLARMGESGLRYVQAHFDRRKIADEYLGLIENVILPTRTTPALRTGPV